LGAVNTLLEFGADPAKQTHKKQSSKDFAKTNDMKKVLSTPNPNKYPSIRYQNFEKERLQKIQQEKQRIQQEQERERQQRQIAEAQRIEQEKQLELERQRQVQQQIEWQRQEQARLLFEKQQFEQQERDRIAMLNKQREEAEKMEKEKQLKLKMQQELVAQQEVQRKQEIERQEQNRIELAQEVERLRMEKISLSANVTTSTQKRGLRLGLLVGNSNYKHAGVLDNPVKDVNLIDSRLKSLGFLTTCLYDLGQNTDMETAINDFCYKLMDAGSELECCMFYYAGHGMSVNDENFLIPTDANICGESDVKYKCISLSYIVEKLAEVCEKSVQMFVFDACRSVPPKTPNWRSKTRSIPKEGLAYMNTPKGSFLMFSTAPGTKAQDHCAESNDNSPFALALSRSLQSSFEAYQVFKMTSLEVERMTNGEQTPFVSSSLNQDFRL
jgi:hypothetical protein